ncbi:Type IV pilus biogenesis and competence protein pilQ precursor [Serratia fonticola]|uniref:Type IV pilus biogenesis and competence protein pilQ n=1 Tax=Serratia fonticola TaxID=47917 RepID=A0A4U9WRA2_SERFO|nr:Type IV pilus biogenesis and competence protein pilQ precursor [Serratia fonticola]
MLLRDTAQALAQLKTWVAEMDTPLEQVQLAAHIVTISSENLRELGVRWGAGGRRKASQKAADRQFQRWPAGREQRHNGRFPPGTQSAGASWIWNCRRWSRKIRWRLSPARACSPHICKPPSIKQGTEIPYEVSSGSSGATSIEFKDAVLGMEVTPKILPNGRITLTLQISQNMPGRSIKQAKERRWRSTSRRLKPK